MMIILFAYYIYKELDDLIPIIEKDFTNFKDIIIDKYI